MSLPAEGRAQGETAGHEVQSNMLNTQNRGVNYSSITVFYTSFFFK
jgi:hypothetical protein